MANTYKLDEIAARFGWSRRKLIWRLKGHGIAFHGSGRDAVLTEADVDRLLRAEDVTRSSYATTRAIRSRMQQEKKKSH
jgi:hypothetical protein